jgi:hypothetical protein
LVELIEEGTPEMKQKHPNHEFVLAFINGQVIQGKYDECAAWEDVKALGQFDYYPFFRIKPNTRMINGFEVPAPLSEEPEDGFVFFYPILTTENMVRSTAYASKHDKKHCFERGLCFANEEDAFKNARAMVRIDPNGPK